MKKPVFINTCVNSVHKLFSITRLSLYMRHSSKFVVRKRRDGVYLGCFKVLLAGQEDYEVLYNGLTFWTKRDEDSFEFFLRKIRNNGGMERFESKADELFAVITQDTLEFLKKEGYGFDFYDRAGRLLPTNNDLFIISKANDSNIVIARLGKEEVERFMRIQKMTDAEKYDILTEIIYTKQDSPNAFNPHSSDLVFGENIPVSSRGLGPDYDDPGLERFLYAGNIDNARIKIKMAGNLDEDFRRAFAEAGIDTSDPSLANFVWHHVDDLDFDEEGIPTCTMQLINKAFHKQVIVKSLKGMIQPPDDVLVAGRHIGSVKLWEEVFLVPYK